MKQNSRKIFKLESHAKRKLQNKLEKLFKLFQMNLKKKKLHFKNEKKYHSDKNDSPRLNLNLKNN